MIAQRQQRSKAIENWPKQGQWRYEDWQQLPDDGLRYEVIDGVLHMSPPPSTAHQTTSGNLYATLHNYVRQHNLGRVFSAPVGIQLPTQPVPLQPDIVFIASEGTAVIGPQYIEGVPDLIIEILSPSNWPFDRNDKFLIYQEAGVPEYWLADYRARTVEVFVLDEGEYVLQEGILRIGDTISSHILTGLKLPVATVFQDL